MSNGDEFLDIAPLQAAQRSWPMVLPWPSRGNPGGMLSISSPDEWRDFVVSLSLPPGIPEIVAAKYRRAQTLYFLGGCTSM